MAKTISYKLDLQERLADKGYAVGYLNECASDNDPALVCLALSNVIQVHPAMGPFFISAYARFLRPSDLQKLKQTFPDLKDYFERHHDVLGALHA